LLVLFWTARYSRIFFNFIQTVVIIF
jgi:hypothetical protein